MREKDRRTGEKGYERIFINAGKSDGFFAANLIDLLNKNVRNTRVDVGRIDLLPGYSLFDVKKADAPKVISALKNVDFYGKRIYAEIADLDKDYSKSGGGKSARKNAESSRKKAIGDDRHDKRSSHKENFGERNKKNNKAKDNVTTEPKKEKKKNGNFDKFIK